MYQLTHGGSHPLRPSRSLCQLGISSDPVAPPLRMSFSSLFRRPFWCGFRTAWPTAS